MCLLITKSLPLRRDVETHVNIFFQSAEVSLCYILLLLKIQYVVISIFKYLYRCKSGYTIKTRAKSVCYPGPLPSALIMLFSHFMKI